MGKRTLKLNCKAIVCSLLLLLPMINNAQSNKSAKLLTDGDQVYLTDFVSKSNGGTVTIVNDHAIKLSNTGGDHFAMYNGVQKLFKSFIYEADVKLISGVSASLVIGVQDLANPWSRWLGVNFDRGRSDAPIRIFDVGSGRGDIMVSKKPDYLSFDDTLHMRIEVFENGDFIYTIGNPDSLKLTNQGHITNWTGGYIGLLTYQSEILFSNVKFTDRTNYSGTKIDNESGYFKTNLNELYYNNGSWSVGENGLTSAVSGDSFVFSSVNAKDFTYVADVTFNERKNSAASLLLRGKKDTSNKNMYIANINPQTGVARLFKFENNAALDLVSPKTIKLTDDNKYHLEVTAIGKHIVFKINGEVVANTADYTSSSIYGQNDAILEGYAGFLSWEANATYQNAVLTPITNDNNPQLTHLSVSSVDGTVEHNIQYDPNQYVYIAYVSNNTTAINLDVEKSTASTDVIITNTDNQVLSKDLPVNEGINTYTLTAKNADATILYRIVVIRRKDPESYYNEEYRDQYHFSVKEGWANDPNGLVYYNGEYHLFHQFYTAMNWGPMHWAHSVSKDLIHWEELPITFYPDEYGTMYSGSAVVDETNTSGLFTEEDGSTSLTGGMVSIITADGNGERVIIAYSKDGRNWKKKEGVVKDWTEDPLNNSAFRDPKVFRYQNKWFMVIAGGPLRIYSSDNLIDWTVESTYPGLETECPDLYRLPVMENNQITAYKWVLSRGGRYYKVGDFLPVDGKWKFVADSQYEGTGTQNDGVMNFAKDSYAATTYSMGKFDEYQRVVELNWMNGWTYSNDVDEISHNNTFNGTFCLQLELSLIKDANGKYVLQQTPIKEYESLRNLEKTVSIKDKTINNETLKLDYTGQSYEIVADFAVEKGVSEVGFNVRVGSENYTKIGYSIADDKFYIDRTKSGLAPANFLESYSQKSVLTNDGKIRLHIFVDRASAELFANNYTITGTAQIYPVAFCDGVEAFAVGGTATANIDIYPLNTIWTNKAIVTKPKEVVVQSTNLSNYVGDVFSVKAAVFPYDLEQSVKWQLDDNEVVSMQTTGTTATFTAKKAGTVNVKVFSSVDTTVYKEISLTIRDNKFVTNLNWNQISDKWYFDNTDFVGQSEANTNTFSFAEKRVDAEKYSYKADVDITSGIINVIFGSQTTNAYDGCYAVQLNSWDRKIRLFDFKDDYTFTTVSGEEPSTPGKYHIVIEVDGSTITVNVNDIKYISMDVAPSGRVYRNGLLGLAVSNAFAKFSNVLLTSDSSTAIVPLITPAVKVISVNYYNLMGIETDQHKPGIFIRKTVYSNGTCKIEKLKTNL